MIATAFGKVTVTLRAREAGASRNFSYRLFAFFTLTFSLDRIERDYVAFSQHRKSVQQVTRDHLGRLHTRERAALGLVGAEILAIVVQRVRRIPAATAIFALGDGFNDDAKRIRAPTANRFSFRILDARWIVTGDDTLHV